MTTFRYKNFKKARDQGTLAILQRELSGNGKRQFVKRSRLRSVGRVEELNLSANSFTFDQQVMVHVDLGEGDEMR